MAKFSQNDNQEGLDLGRSFVVGTLTVNRLGYRGIFAFLILFGRLVLNRFVLFVGFLVSANATLSDSEADLALRPSQIDLPRQSDEVYNLQLGYESERFSARIAATRKK